MAWTLLLHAAPVDGVLEGRLREGQLVELLRPNEKIRGVIESVSMPIRHASERGSRTTMCVVRVRGRKE